MTNVLFGFALKSDVKKWVLENEEPCYGHAFNVSIVRAWLRIIDEVKISNPRVASRRLSRSKSRKHGSDKGGVATLVGKAICPDVEDKSVGLPIVFGTIILSQEFNSSASMRSRVDSDREPRGVKTVAYGFERTVDNRGVQRGWSEFMCW